MNNWAWRHILSWERRKKGNPKSKKKKQKKTQKVEKRRMTDAYAKFIDKLPKLNWMILSQSRKCEWNTWWCEIQIPIPIPQQFVKSSYTQKKNPSQIAGHKGIPMRDRKKKPCININKTTFKLKQRYLSVIRTRFVGHWCGRISYLHVTFRFSSFVTSIFIHCALGLCSQQYFRHLYSHLECWIERNNWRIKSH